MHNLKLFTLAAKWSTGEKALQLAKCLNGDALSSLLLLSPDDRSDYDALVRALKRRFVVCSAASLLHFELCSHQHHYGELLRELEGLVHGIYARIPPAIQDELARDHFLEALFPGSTKISPRGFGVSYREGNAHWRTHLTSPRTGLS